MNSKLNFYALMARKDPENRTGWKPKKPAVKQKFFEEKLSVNRLTALDRFLGKKDEIMKIHSGIQGPILNRKTERMQIRNSKKNDFQLPEMFSKKQGAFIEGIRKAAEMPNLRDREIMDRFNARYAPKPGDPPPNFKSLAAVAPGLASDMGASNFRDAYPQFNPKSPLFDKEMYNPQEIREHSAAPLKSTNTAPIKPSSLPVPIVNTPKASTPDIPTSTPITPNIPTGNVPTGNISSSTPQTENPITTPIAAQTTSNNFGGVAGGLLGGLAGGIGGYMTGKNENPEEDHRWRNALLGAGALGVGGALAGNYLGK